MFKYLIILLLTIVSTPAFSADITPDITTGNIPYDDTQCATQVLENALYASAGQVSETSPETEIRQWIYSTFQDKTVLQNVLNCPELQNIPEDESIKFLPIVYNFPGGRQVIVNYETQPKVLKQHLMLTEKRTITEATPSPRIGDMNDASIWTNTDPAWYAIMVVQAGALDEFVGPDKNNTISMKWINDNIDSIYPKGYNCTSKSALASDDDIINLAMHETVNIEDDSNDYYVAGDANLSWIGYAEVGLDVVITVATAGGGAVLTGITKATRASRTLKNLSASLKTLRQSESVVKYIKIGGDVSKATQELSSIDKARDAYRQINTIRDSMKGADASKTARLTEDLKAAEKAYSDELMKLGKNADDFKSLDDFDKLRTAKSDELSNLQKTQQELAKTDDVKKYQEQSKTFSELNKYRNALRGIRIKQRGNIIARTWRAFKAANTGGRLLRSSASVARSSMKSGRIRDWLFQSTMSNLGKLTKMEEMGGFLYGALVFLGDMYDFTETSTGTFTNDIDFKPLTLLSADDLQGQENVVNYGMWLMWQGDSVNPEDDDAAYLQAMDFANKFHFYLQQTQEEKNTNSCNVDIYVVRPVIRNPDKPDASLYYLIMNDQPWTTSE